MTEKQEERVKKVECRKFCGDFLTNDCWGDHIERRRGGVDEALSEGEERRGLGLAVRCRTSIDTTAAFA